MTYAFTQDLPLTRDVYARIQATLPDETPPGMILRMAYEIENGLRVVEVWESEADYDLFVNDRLWPILSDGMFDTGDYQPPRQEPPRHPISVVDVWHGGDISPDRRGQAEKNLERLQRGRRP